MTAQNALIGYLNHIEAGTLTAGVAEAERPITALADASGGDYWQAPVTSTWFELDAGATVAWRALSLHRTNLTTAATVRWRLGTTAGAGDVLDTGAVSGGLVSGYGQVVRVLASELSARHLRCDIADSTNPDGFLRVGLAFAGPAWQPLRNFAYDWAAGWSDPTEMVQTIGGQEHAVPGPPARRALEFAFEAITEAEIYDHVHEIDRRRGVSGNALFMPFPDSAYLGRDAIFGRITDNPLPRNPRFQLYAKRYVVRERL